MDEATFVGQYADARLAQWWNAAPRLREGMLGLLAVLHQTPLAQLDQFTVGEHTGQPDEWPGERLVFAIRNNRAARGRASPDSFRLSIPLKLQGPLVFAFVSGIGPNPQPGPERQALIAPAFIAAVGQRQQAINHSVLDAIENRKPDQRDALWPIEYAL